jgi:polysaccharide export outer membrane protein
VIKTFRVIGVAIGLLPLTAPPAMAQQPQADMGMAEHADAPYRINAGDELEVLVWGEERLQRSVVVTPDGTFAFPLVGQIKAAGLLPGDIERIITAGLQSQYRGAVPQVTVSVKKASGYAFSVVGKIRNPGTFAPGHYVNVLEALALAGGPTEFAQTGSVRLIRKKGNQLVTIPLHLSQALRGDTGHLTADQIPDIQSGDTLVVP